MRSVQLVPRFKDRASALLNDPHNSFPLIETGNKTSHETEIIV